jgi:hypothetical protein
MKRIRAAARESGLDIYGLGRDREKWESALTRFADSLSDKGYELSTHEKQAEFAMKRCGCHTCNPIDASNPDTVYMRLCPDCGNKRCPKATNHTNACTNSNDSNQEGSIY